MPKKSIDQYIEEANARLKGGESALKISRVGQRLYIRGTLPPKPDSSKSKPHQQTITPQDNRANVACLKLIEAECKVIDKLLLKEQFDWIAYQKRDKPPEQVGDWIERFKTNYFARSLPDEDDPEFQQKLNKVQTTWDTHYWFALKRLGNEAKITPEILYAEIKKTRETSRSRQKLIQVYKVFAAFCGLELNTLDLKCTYSVRVLNKRMLPSDETIIEFRKQFSNPSWKWAYSVIATYGIRNHEVFYVDSDSLQEEPGILFIMEGAKVNEHEVWPCYPEWWKEWNLKEVRIPPCSGSNAALGHRVSTEFRRAKARYFKSNDFLSLEPHVQELKRKEVEKIKPYNLRHAWAVRTILMGWPDSLAAAQMDHSLEVHNRRYQRWLDRRHHQKVFDILVNRPDRPKPPKVSD